MKHKTSIAVQSLLRLIEHMHDLLIKRKQTKEASQATASNLLRIEENNSDFMELLNNKRAIFAMTLSVTVVVLAGGIDALITNSGLAILCDQLGFPTWSKYIVPGALVTLELGLSYSQAMKERAGEAASWLARNVQYAILVLLASFTALTIFYTLEGYNPQIDGTNYTMFVVFTLTVQLGLLLASLFMHIWLIRHASDIAEAIAFFIFRNAYRSSANQLAKLNNDHEAKYNEPFLKAVQKFSHNFFVLKNTEPGVSQEIIHATPIELQQEIRRITGNDLFASPHKPEPPHGEQTHNRQFDRAYS